VDTLQGPGCLCNEGYARTGQGCVDIDECADGSHTCDLRARCTNTPGSYTCACAPDYLGDGHTCEKEICLAQPCDTFATCTPSADNATRTCTCVDGLVGTGEMGDCETPDPCKPRFEDPPCDPLAECSLVDDAPTCACPPGYEGPGTWSSDPSNPGCVFKTCAMNRGGCTPQQSCQDTPTGPVCTDQCRPGFMVDPTGACHDIDECVGPSPCPGAHNTCMNTVGSFQCFCESGWTGDPANCVQLQPCDLVTCPAHAICTNLPNSEYSCDCGAGFETRTDPVTTEISCVDLDECTNGTAGCSVGELCVNTVGAVECLCPPGVTGGQCKPGYQAMLATSAYAHACAVSTDGTLWCWGDNRNSQLGVPGSSFEALPVQVGTDSDWASVVAGLYETCGLKTDGSLLCWGVNVSNFTTVSIPTLTPWQWKDIAQLELGGQFACAIRVNTTGERTLWCWGSNVYGQSGSPVPSPPLVAVPQQIGTDTDWDSISTGLDHVCGLKLDGSLWCWGRNNVGQVGTSAACTGTGKVCFADPVQVNVAGVSRWSRVSAGGWGTCAIADGQLYCWGSNERWMLGDCSYAANFRAAPTQVGSDQDWAEVTVAGANPCALKTDGSLWCWGMNGFGATIGGIPPANVCDPAQVGADKTWRAISSGYAFTCGVKADTSLWCWGLNGAMQQSCASGSMSEGPCVLP
jgi:alpha-tubulin suppressor-like RCC1 family protein